MRLGWRWRAFTSECQSLMGVKRRLARLTLPPFLSQTTLPVGLTDQLQLGPPELPGPCNPGTWLLTPFSPVWDPGRHETSGLFNLDLGLLAGG